MKLPNRAELELIAHQQEDTYSYPEDAFIKGAQYIIDLITGGLPDYAVGQGEGYIKVFLKGPANFRLISWDMDPEDLPKSEEEK